LQAKDYEVFLIAGRNKARYYEEGKGKRGAIRGGEAQEKDEAGEGNV